MAAALAAPGCRVNNIQFYNSEFPETETIPTIVFAALKSLPYFRTLGVGRLKHKIQPDDWIKIAEAISTSKIVNLDFYSTDKKSGITEAAWLKLADAVVALDSLKSIGLGTLEQCKAFTERAQIKMAGACAVSKSLTGITLSRCSAKSRGGDGGIDMSEAAWFKFAEAIGRSGTLRTISLDHNPSITDAAWAKFAEALAANKAFRSFNASECGISEKAKAQILEAWGTRSGFVKF